MVDHPCRADGNGPARAERSQSAIADMPSSSQITCGKGTPLPEQQQQQETRDQHVGAALRCVEESAARGV